MYTHYFSSQKKHFFSIHTIITLFFIVLLFIQPTLEGYFINGTDNESNINPASSLETPDGLFSGTWKSDNYQGNLNGSIFFGRSDKIGTIDGYVSITNFSSRLRLKGRIQNDILIGTLYAKSKEKSMILIGYVHPNMPLFTFSVYSPGLGMITGKGTYDGSFLPVPSGPYNIGVRSYHLVDESRSEWFTDEKSDYRELMIKVWYPTNCSNFDKRMMYMDEITFNWLRNQGPIPLITIPNDAYSFIHPHMYEDVTPVRSRPFPVLLFSPGYDGVDVIYTSFIDELVSYGYVVVSMNHPFISGVTVFPDGEVNYIAKRPENSSNAYVFLKRSQQTVVDDALFVLDRIEQLNHTDSLLSGIFDCSRVGMFGHSFGGAATLNCCYEDERIQAGFTLDGVVYNEFLTGSIDTPFLLMCAEQRFNHSSYDYVWSQFSSDAFQIGIEGSAHYSFTDVGILLSHMLPLIPSSLLGFGSADSDRVIKITRLFEKAFFDVYIKDVNKIELIDLFDDFNDVSVKIK